MTKERYNYLMYENIQADLTKEERKEGWHFCPDWDFLLVGEDDISALKCCTCHSKYINILKKKLFKEQCPKCKSVNIDAMEHDIDENRWQYFCMNCNYEWEG